MKNQPLVSIICLCYNQKSFVESAILSVYAQTYLNMELIVVDDASTDGSQQTILDLQKKYHFQFIALENNEGNCKAFNHGFWASKGDFVIDLAADDILLPARVQEGVADFQKSSMNTGIHFSDAFIISENGQLLKTHYSRNESGKIIDHIPESNLYQELISRYFICPPTMMIRREVLEEMNGYDESLTYEDFDFWIRSSRNWKYILNPAPLVKKRIVPHSLGQKQQHWRNQHLVTTYKVCEKIFNINQNADEDKALILRCKLEIRQCLKTFNFGLITNYWKLIRKTQRRLSSPSSMER